MKQIPRSRTVFLEDKTLQEIGGLPWDSIPLRGILGWFASEGYPLPPGQTWIEAEQAFNFVLVAENAESVTLLLYGEGDQIQPLFSFTLDHRIHKLRSIWFCKVSKKDAGAVRYYGYSISGPSPGGPDVHHAFDPDKVLLDPFARAVWFPPGLTGTPRSVRGRPRARPLWEC